MKYERGEVVVLEITELKKSFNKKLVIKHIDFTVEQGKFVSLLGQSGCGKTTLLRLIAGLETADQGSIRFDGKTYDSGNDKNFVSPADRDLGMVFQDFALWPHMTVFQNVAYPLKVRKDTKDLNQRVKLALKEVQLEDHIHKSIHELSGGQQQRVSLARAIISESKLILMDEPLSALDAGLREDMQLLIQHLIKTYHMTAIFVTHDQHEAMTMSDEIAVMKNGEIIQFGTPENLYHHPKNKDVAQFIGKGTYVEGHISKNKFYCNQGLVLHSINGLNDGKYGLLIRPENVHVREEGFEAKVLTVSFTGERYQYTADVNDMTVMFYSQQLYHVAETIKLQFDTPANYFIKNGGDTHD